MPSLSSSMLSGIFPELHQPRSPTPAAAPCPTPLLGGQNPVINGEPVLDENLYQLWYNSKKPLRDGCVRILHLTLRRFEHVKRQVLLQQQQWLESEKGTDAAAAAAAETDLFNPDSSLSTTKDRTQRQKVNLHALFVNALPRQRLEDVMTIVLLLLGRRILYENGETDQAQQTIYDDEKIPDDSHAAKMYLDKLIKRLCDVGLGGPVAERAYAVAADMLLDSFIARGFGDLDVYVNDAAISRGPRDSTARARSSRPAIPGGCPLKDLEHATLEMFCPVLHDFMQPLSALHENALGLDEGITAISPPKGPVTPSKKEMRSVVRNKNINWWLEQARNKLRYIRSKQSYYIITGADTPQRRCGLLDLRELCKDPYGRNLIARGLEKQIDRQLVRPGNSTVEVLDTYMLIIATLSEPIFDGQRVDPSNVLLTRSAGPVRHFLRNREDAARIVILSLLEPKPFEAEPNRPGASRIAPPSTDNFSGQISTAMYYHKNPHDTLGHFEGHDLLDMNWMPEPVDALSGHRFNLSLDAIGHITTIAPPESFVKELELILGERLLKTDQLNFEVEMRLLKIFHARFGETQIQACENMLNDMMESAKWNEKIHPSDAPSDPPHDFQAKIISQASWQELRWEQLQRERFQLPPPMLARLESYQARFGELQADRYLEWVPQLGRVTIDLELQDRTVTEEVTPLQAAVIHQFTNPTPSSSPATRTLHDITTALQGDNDTAGIAAALHFWVAKVVLQPVAGAPDTYTVLETLRAGDDAHAAAAQASSELETAAAAAEAAAPTRAARLAEHAETYAAYVVGMLTNQGAMEVERIHSLLKMLAPGGFAFDVEDLEGLLEEMSLKGVIERAGALWRIVQT